MGGVNFCTGEGILWKTSHLIWLSHQFWNSFSKISSDPPPTIPVTPSLANRHLLTCVCLLKYELLLIGPPPKKSLALLISFLAGDFPPFFGGVDLTFFVVVVSSSESEDTSCDTLHYWEVDLHTRLNDGSPSLPLLLSPFCLLSGSYFTPCSNTCFKIVVVIIINYHWVLRTKTGLYGMQWNLSTPLGHKKVSWLVRCPDFRG